LDRVKPRFGDTLPLPLEGPKERIERGRPLRAALSSWLFSMAKKQERDRRYG
jgi:hypothetical protein